MPKDAQRDAATILMDHVLRALESARAAREAEPIPIFDPSDDPFLEIWTDLGKALPSPGADDEAWPKATEVE